MVIQSGAMLAGTALAATLTDRLGVIVMLTAQGAGYVLGGFCFALLTRRATTAGGAPTAPADQPTEEAARVVTSGLPS
jgi:hypothetical protein